MVEGRNVCLGLYIRIAVLKMADLGITQVVLVHKLGLRLRCPLYMSNRLD